MLDAEAGPPASDGLDRDARGGGDAPVGHVPEDALELAERVVAADPEPGPESADVLARDADLGGEVSVADLPEAVGDKVEGGRESAKVYPATVR